MLAAKLLGLFKGTKMITYIIEYSIAHILSGILAVYFAGIVDRKMEAKGSAPTNVLFICGPLGLFVASLFLIGLYNPLSFLSYFYNKGLKK